MKTEFFSHWKVGEVGVIFDSIARHARMVSVLKLALATVAILLLASVVIIASTRSDDSRFRLVFDTLEMGEGLGNEAPVMINPSFRGQDNEGNPFTVTARNAKQKTPDVVLLDALNADITLKDKTWLSLLADSGELNLTAKTAQLSGHVQLFHDAGYEFRTDSVFLELQSGTAVGNSPVEAQGSLGILKANRFTIDDKGKTIRFEGGVNVKFYPKSKG